MGNELGEIGIRVLGFWIQFNIHCVCVSGAGTLASI